jgi:hypothetical protein
MNCRCNNVRGVSVSTGAGLADVIKSMGEYVEEAKYV